MNRILILLGCAGILLGTSCKSKKAEIAREAKFLVTSPIRLDTAINEDYVCQIHSIRHIELRSQERGYIENIYVDEGQLVKEGQLLFRIMPRLYNAEYQKAQAETELARIEYLNTKALADSNVVSKNELAMAKARFDRANAILALAEVHLNFTEIRAPFAGIIDRFHVRLGSLVDEGDLLTNLSDNSEMWVYFNVPEAEYLEYKSKPKDGDKEKVSLLMANNKSFSYQGLITAIEADFNNETGNIPFRATFPNPEGLLRHGETGNIVMTVPLKKALLIPQKATFEVLEKRYVYVVDKDHNLQSREIEVAAEFPHVYAIKSGLKESDKILLDGLRLVRDKDKIEYDFIRPKAALSQLDLYAE